ncbi:MAG: tetratricopeptide repeat protein [Microscillaceae bacterium]|nr:tetratricopeptide repeat protein [Microscillaceae bacterium]MDW8460029.1 tetratricopeptide repeat protein [Cytophagales bacterium]
MQHLFFVFTTCVVFLLISACESKIYQNIVGKYNAYFIAKEKLMWIEKKRFQVRIDDYNSVLDVFPAVDSIKMKSSKDSLEDCIKKAAIVINRRKKSRWLDASYIAVGKARQYMQNYEDAIITYKYVNAKAKTDKDRQTALLCLAKTFFEQGDLNSAKSVIDYLRTMEIRDRTNRLEFYLVKAHYFREIEDWKETAAQLNQALKLMPGGERKGRIRFIMGQVLQNLGQDEQALKQYRKVLNNNPTYEMSFYARLFMGQVANTNNKADTRKILRYYKRLLKDSKNKDYLDKIYYEMAMFELKQKDTTQALDYLQKATEVSKNPQQKGYTFLKLGEIHYKRKQFELAQQDYDSVIIHLPKHLKNYAEVQKRQKILAEFVKHLRIYQREDSLQRMAAMPPTELEDYLNKALRKQEEAKMQAEERQRLLAQKRNQENQKQQGTLDLVNTQQSGLWYFYNPNSVSLGKAAFLKKWKNRKLEDHWRRSNKPSTATAEDDSLTILAHREPTKEEILKKRIDTEKAKIWAEIEKTRSKIDSSNIRMENAAFELGKIYDFKLDEPRNAIHIFEVLLKRFPNSKFESETLYNLFLLYQKQNQPDKAEHYKNLLLEKYPNSLFAKMANNPNYLEESKKNEALLKAEYKRAYELFEHNQPTEALAVITEVEQKYPQNLLADKFAYLKILIKSSQEKNRAVHIAALKEFLQKYPESSLVNYINDLLRNVLK